MHLNHQQKFNHKYYHLSSIYKVLAKVLQPSRKVISSVIFEEIVQSKLSKGA